MGRPTRWQRTLKWLVAVDWWTWGARVANVLAMAGIAYILLYLPLQKKLILDQQDQFMWNVFALVLTLWVSYQLAKQASKREVMREARATARSAMNRILQVRAGVESILTTIDDKISRVTVDSEQFDKRVDPHVVEERLADLRQQAAIVAEALVYAEYDWKEILNDDIARQRAATEALAAALENAGELESQLAQAQADIATKEEQVAAEQENRSDLEQEVNDLSKNIKRIQSELAAERTKAASASRDATWPIGTGLTAASLGLPGARVAELASSYWVGGIANYSKAREIASAYSAAHPHARDNDILMHVAKSGIVLGRTQIDTLLADPAIRCHRET